MSNFGYIMCHDCMQIFLLGETLLDKENKNQPYCFLSGDENHTPSWKDETKSKILWKFFADHTIHNIEVKLEKDISTEEFGYSQIGGNRVDDLNEKDYLEHWSNLYCVVARQ